MKTYIVYLSNNEFSVEITQYTIESLEKFGIEYELFDGVVGRDGVKVLADHNRYPSVHIDQHHWTDGTIGCLASHYLLWEKCAKQDEPFLILEQDGVVIKDPRELIDQVERICHLDSINPFSLRDKNHYEKYNIEVEKYLKGVSKYPWNHFYGKKVAKLVPNGSFRGTYGYLLQPKGAQEILEWTKLNGLLPSDACLNHSATYLQRSNCTYVRLNPFFESLHLQKKYSLRNPNNPI